MYRGFGCWCDTQDLKKICGRVARQDISVDGRAYDGPASMVYKGSMLSGVPNLAFAVGCAPRPLARTTFVRARVANRKASDRLHKTVSGSQWPWHCAAHSLSPRCCSCNPLTIFAVSR